MTVAELISRLVLCRADAAAPVVVTWEGTLREVTEEDVYVSSDGVLVVNAESGYDKERHLETGVRPELNSWRDALAERRRWEERCAVVVADCDCGHAAETHGFVGADIRSECSECSCVRYRPWSTEEA